MEIDRRDWIQGSSESKALSQGQEGDTAISRNKTLRTVVKSLSEGFRVRTGTTAS